jgi:Arc/MetJ-type ribon-helix-helix transcriptional regulator
MYGMVKTTIYLPEPLKERVRRAAAEQRRSEAAVIRDALEQYTADRERPRPRLPLFKSIGDSSLAERVDEILAEGFGRD